MNHFSVASGFAALFSILFPSLAFGFEKPKPQPVSGKIDWVFDYEEGKLESLKTKKPMFVVIRCER